ncbi:MAG: helix-turn-helix domain-containing protein [Candidatus Nanohaloarchaea archaeon]
MDFLDLDGKEDREIIFEVFDLNQLQRSLFEEMKEAKLTVKELASRVDRNRSTVQRALQDMLEKDIVMREGKTDRTVYYVYTTLPMEELREVTMTTLDSWHEKVKNRLS